MTDSKIMEPIMRKARAKFKGTAEDKRVKKLLARADRSLAAGKINKAQYKVMKRLARRVRSIGLLRIVYKIQRRG